MRRRLVQFALSTLLAVSLAACEPPRASAPDEASLTKLAESQPPLPAPVQATVRQLREIAANGGYRELAELAEATPGFRSNVAGMTHKAYWHLRQRTGDFPAVQVGRLLNYGHAVAAGEQGSVYIWPWLATVEPDEMTPRIAREIDALLGKGQADRLKAGAVWPGYVMGIAEDGRWLFFVSG